MKNKGHSNFDFVDVYLDDDNQVFIDPAMLERANDPWSIEAVKHMYSYFDRMFYGFRTNNLEDLFAHAHEQNATKLGYGNGNNGKGKTADGLQESLCKLSLLVKDIPTIGNPKDVPVLVEGFAEDCMSDLLTNILHSLLNDFTAEQMSKLGIPPQGNKTFHTWDASLDDWKEVTRPTWFYKGKELLMVPKWIVRKRYLFKAHQYLYGVIIERMQEENGWQDMKKIDVWRNIPRNSEHWEYETVIEYTRENPDALLEYHSRVPYYYRRSSGCMSDEDLDEAIYGYVVEETA